MDILVIAAIYSVLGIGLAFPAGPPLYEEVCTGMTPKVFVQGYLLGHGGAPHSPASNPFEVNVNTNCYNEKIKIQGMCEYNYPLIIFVKVDNQ